MTYTRFALMIATSTLVMFGLMYLNTYAWEHVFFSETRAYMAILMGAVMAFVMLAFMAKMYPSRAVNTAILVGSVIVFALSLWLVRSQVTVNGTSFMRAMIPHHSIAIMTSGRAEIEDARVRKMAEGIIAAQQKEIAEMRALIADTAAGNIVSEVYQDPAPRVGTVEDALGNTLLAELDPAPLTAEEAGMAVPGSDNCGFRMTRGSSPILWASADGTAAAMKLNGVILPLTGNDGTFTAEGLTMTVTPIQDGLRAESRLAFDLTPGPTARFDGFWTCGS